MRKDLDDLRFDDLTPPLPLGIVAEKLAELLAQCQSNVKGSKPLYSLVGPHVLPAVVV